MIKGLAPGFLVAAPSLVDPNFHRALILLVDHSEEGSLGFVVNRGAPVSFGDVAEELDLEPCDDAVETPVLIGGPVAPHTGWIVFDAAKTSMLVPGTVDVATRVGLSASRDALEAVANGGGPATPMMVLGYAGWGAGQLDEELRDGSWIAVPLDAAILFDTPIAERWERALRMNGIEPGRMATGSTGSA